MRLNPLAPAFLPSFPNPSCTHAAGWDFNFPEMWAAVAAQGAELVLWPSAGKDSLAVAGAAMVHNIYIAANGAGQFYDRVGRTVPADHAFNVVRGARFLDFSCAVQPH